KLPLAQEGTWWWTVGARDPQGAWHFAPAQSFTAIPKFTNRVTSSPYLMRSLLGQMGAEDLREARAQTFANLGETTARTAGGAGPAHPPGRRLGLRAERLDARAAGEPHRRPPAR